MNVIKFNIEIKKRFAYFDKKESIHSIIEKNFQSEIDFDGDFYKKIKSEWKSIEYENIKSLNSEKSLKGYFTTKNATFFVFEKNSNNVRSKNNLSYEVVSYGDISVESLLNLTFKKINSIISKPRLSCEHIGETRIFIFPFNSNGNDIYSYQLKVRADLVKPINISLNDIIRWGLILLIGLISLSIYFNNPEDSLKNILLSVIASVIFYLSTDLILYLVVPLIFKNGYRNVKINNLSTVVETNEEMIVTKTEPLTIPE